MESTLGRVDPLIKIVFSLIFAVVVLITKDIKNYLILTILAIAPFFFSGISFKRILKIFTPFLILFVFTMLFHTFLTPGEIIFQVGFLHITRAGLRNGVIFSMRLMLLILSASVFTLTTYPFDLSDRLAGLFVNIKETLLREIPFILGLSMRFIPTLFAEGRRILLAQRARGINIKIGKAVFSILFPVVLSAIRKGDELGNALSARGYEPGERRTLLIRKREYYLDIAFLIYAFLPILLVIFI